MTITTTDTTSRGELAEPREVDQEEWRTIPRAPGYEASNLGRIRSRMLYRGDPGPRIIATRPSTVTDHLRVTMSVAGRKVHPSVHHLVLEAFVGPRPEGLEVRHLDGDATNNRLENLRYGTHSENELDKVRHGTHQASSRTHCVHGHPFDEDNTYRDSRGYRICRACSRRRGHAYRNRAS